MSALSDKSCLTCKRVGHLEAAAKAGQIICTQCGNAEGLPAFLSRMQEAKADAEAALRERNRVTMCMEDD